MLRTRSAFSACSLRHLEPVLRLRVEDARARVVAQHVLVPEDVHPLHGRYSGVGVMP